MVGKGVLVDFKKLNEVGFLAYICCVCSIVENLSNESNFWPRSISVTWVHVLLAFYKNPTHPHFSCGAAASVSATEEVPPKSNLRSRLPFLSLCLES